MVPIEHIVNSQVLDPANRLPDQVILGMLRLQLHSDPNGHRLDDTHSLMPLRTTCTLRCPLAAGHPDGCVSINIRKSVRFPLRYYSNNIASTVSLCTVMDELGQRRLVFSSSAAVYGDGRAAQFTHGRDVHAGRVSGRGLAHRHRADGLQR